MYVTAALRHGATMNMGAQGKGHGSDGGFALMTSFSSEGIRNPCHTNTICLGVYGGQPQGGSRGPYLLVLTLFTWVWTGPADLPLLNRIW